MAAVFLLTRLTEIRTTLNNNNGNRNKGTFCRRKYNGSYAR
jgi:hypothetical protein